MLGQGIVPEQYHPVVDVMDDEELKSFLQQIKSNVDKTVSQLPTHDAYVRDYCKSTG
jgi:tryptophan halogenase